MLLVGLLVACGGGGDDTSPTATLAPTLPLGPTATPTQSAEDLADEYDEIVAQIDFVLYAPTMDSMELADVHMGGTDQQPVVVSVYHLDGNEEQRLTIFQSDGLVNHGMTGEVETTEVWGVEARFSHDEDGLGRVIHDLTWDIDGRTFSVTARSVDAETVLEFAESLEPLEPAG